jgi:hypothetical protein
LDNISDVTITGGATYSIGDTGPAGGKIFITPSTSGNTTGKYFEIALVGSEVERTFSESSYYETAVTGADGTANCGSASFRWDTVFAENGTINTSDANEKKEIVNISDVEKRVAVKLKSSMKRFKFKDGNRYHFGTIAQDVKAAFESEGLIAEEYGVFCSDTWTNEDGTEQTRLGIRYDELFAFIISTL